MKITRAIVLAAAAAVSISTHAQQPPDVVQSDANGNTAMGQNALEHTNGAPGQSEENTAAGHSALFSNTQGSENTGFGYGVLFTTNTGSFNSALGQGALGSNSTGWNSVAVGADALNFSTTPDNNTAIGTWALAGTTTGGGNTATGAYASICNLSGNDNTAVGAYALSGGSFPIPHGNGPTPCPLGTATGSENTASGYAALNANSTGADNSAMGSQALVANTTGSDNTSSGASSLFSNTSGSNNTASGFDSLFANTTGDSNTATGHHSLPGNTVGFHNTADGAQALFSNTSGNSNTALGLESLYSNTTGSNNIAVGVDAGYNLTGGSNDIDIGNKGTAGESATIRLGTAGTQTAAYIAGVSTNHITGAAVYVTANGQLGVLASSERYKTDVQVISAETSRLRRLRPVSFHLKSEPNGALQYGLLAEQVDEVYPDLVIRGEHGTVEGIRYDELAPLLLSEIQRQQKQLAAQSREMASLQRKVTQLMEAGSATAGR